MFSMRGIVEFLKSLVKLASVVAVAVLMLRPELNRLPGLSGLDAASLLAELSRLIVRLGFGVFIALTVIAILDYAYQRFSFTKSMRMSKQEVKEEHKQSEGDPMVRARLRQIRMERARKRMMAAVPTASVVVTNPTHVAVALKYELGGLGAPQGGGEGRRAHRPAHPRDRPGARRADRREPAARPRALWQRGGGPGNPGRAL